MENSSSSSTSVSTSRSDHRQYLNNLPDLVYYHILKNLDLDDLWNLRLISKRFYSIIKNYHIYELSFLDYYNDNWFTITRPSRPEYRLPPSKLDLLIRPSNNLLNLKYLRIEEIRNHHFRLDNLNIFTKLQILEIGGIDLVSDNLQLPDLKALNIHIPSDDLEDVSIVIDTPNLHSLALRNDADYDLINNQLKFNHPLSIKYLGLDFYDKNTSIFKNLECLEIRDSSLYYFESTGLESGDLLKFNNLKSLRISNFSIDVDELKDLFRSKKNDLEFVFCGVRIKEINKIDESYNTESLLEYQLNNYGELVDDLWFVRDVDYNELVGLLPVNQPADLFTKFINVQEIQIGSRVEDSSQLVQFIRGCPSLHRLYIYNSSLNQEFYDQLPATIKSLSYLDIEEDKDLNLDFKFLNKMPYLRELYTNQDVLIDSQLSLNNFKNLRSFKFRINNRDFCVFKLGRDEYMISNCKKLGLPKHGYVDHDKIIEWSNQLRSKIYVTRSITRKRKLSPS